jgi:WD40 repeat protein
MERSLWFGTSAGEVCLWRVADRTMLLSVQGHTGPIMGVAQSGDGRLVASGGFDRTVKLWEASTGKLLAILQGHSQRGLSRGDECGWAPGGQRRRGWNGAAVGLAE